MHARGLIRILLIEDHPAIVEGIRDYLDPDRFDLDTAPDGETGLARALCGVHDVILLDVMLPARDGLSVCRDMRARGVITPVIMLTARDTVMDKIEGFRAGTDDYLTKPFAVEELEARIVSLYRRSGALKPTPVSAAGITLDFARHRVQREGQEIEVPPTVFRILALLVRRHPTLVSRDELERFLWGNQPPGSDTLRAHMSTLRRLVEKPFGRPLIENVYGTGYRLLP